jgi:hypothetical protein
VSRHSLTAKERFKETIQKVIEATDVEIQRQTGISSHTEPSSLNFAAAQRLNNGIKIKASIEWVFTLNAACFPFSCFVDL